jgi:hypothetical protein
MCRSWRPCLRACRRHCHRLDQFLKIVILSEASFIRKILHLIKLAQHYGRRK